MQPDDYKDPFVSYVYAYLRLDGTPYYVGKGKGDRAFRGKHSVSVPKDMSRIVFIETHLSDLGACAIERRLIRWYRRKNVVYTDLDGSVIPGILRNLTDGGDGTAGMIQSEEHRKKNGDANRGKLVGPKNPMFGKTGIRNPFYGKTHTEETLEILRQPKSEEQKKKQSKAMKGKKKGVKNGPHTAARRKNIGLARKGLRWYTNGIIAKQYKEGKQPDGFRIGRLSQPKPKVVCRIEDRREMDIQNFSAWVKRQIQAENT